MTCNFDFAAIKEQDYAVDPRFFKLLEPREVTIFHSEEQKKMIKGYVGQYGTTLDGLGRILMRVYPTKRLFRQIKDGDLKLQSSGIEVSGVERHWQGNDMVDIFDVKGDILAYLDIVGIKQEVLDYDTPGPKWFHPGRSANIVSKKKNVLASFGELHPKILKKLNIPLCVGFEIYLDDVLPIIENNNITKEFNSYNLQSVKRDFSFDIPNNVNAETLIKAIRSCNEDLIEDIKLFDQFILDDEKKSLAVEITIQPKIDTLTDKEIDRISDKVINSVEKATKGNLRSQ